MRLVDAAGNPISSGKNEDKITDYAPEFVGSVFALVNKITQQPEASFLFLSDSKTISELAKSEKSQGALMSVIASYAAFTYAIKIKKMTQEDFQAADPVMLKDELLAKLDILPMGSLPFDALFELNPELIPEIKGE